MQEQSEKIDMTNPATLYDAREQIANSQFDAEDGDDSGKGGGGGGGGGSVDDTGATGAVATKKKKRRKKKKGQGRRKGKGKQAEIPLIAMEDDVITMPGQQFAVVSFIDKRMYTGLNDGSGTTASCPENLIKIRGVFPSYERAQARVKQLMTVDPYFDLHVLKCGTWTLIGAGKGEDIEYENEGVNDIMSAFFQQHYTDVDKLRSRIQKAKKDGMPGLDAEDPDEFFDAASEVADVSADVGDVPSNNLPKNAKHMTAAQALSYLQETTTSVLSDDEG